MKKKRCIPVALLLALLLSLSACYSLQIDIPVPVGGLPAGETNAAAPAPTQPSESAYIPMSTAPAPSTSAPAVTQPSTAPSTVPSPLVTEPTNAKTPAEMQGAELLQFFNDSLNRIKTLNVGFTKNKLTSILDLQLSNSAANALVGLVKSSLLSETGDETVVPKGGDAAGVFSPSGKSYVSTLRQDDLTAITCEKVGDAYVISLAVKGETNPDTENSAMSRGFDFITVDDVVSTYAPKVGATVARNDIEVVFSDCTATLTVTADGTVQAYKTYVKGVMRMKIASIKEGITISTDRDVTLASTTEYTGFQY